VDDPSITSPATLASSATTLPQSTMTRLGRRLRTVVNERSPIRFLQLRSRAIRQAVELRTGSGKDRSANGKAARSRIGRTDQLARVLRLV
jgi:hypothetical protein